MCRPNSSLTDDHMEESKHERTLKLLFTCLQEETKSCESLRQMDAQKAEEVSETDG